MLHFLGQMQPEFDDECPFIRQHFFQPFGAFQALVEFGGFGQAILALLNRGSRVSRASLP